MTEDLEKKLESLLFWKAEPQNIKKLARILTTDEAAIRTGLDNLTGQLSGRGLRLIRKDDAVALGTAPELGEFLEKLAKEELSAELGRAGLETLTVVLYRAPVAKSEIDYIRGVNSSFILRHLIVRGLIEKTQNPEDGRSMLYHPTFDLLSLLGLTRSDEAPNYNEIRSQLNDFLQ